MTFSRLRSIVGGAGSLAATLLGVWLFLTAEDGHDRLIFGIIGLFFAMCLCATVALLWPAGEPPQKRMTLAPNVAGGMPVSGRTSLRLARRGFVAIAFGIALFACAGVMLFVVAPSEFTVPVGLLSFAFAAFGTAVLGIRARVPLIVFDRDELTYVRSFTRRVSIPYREILDVELVRTSKGQSCAIYPRDAEGFLAAQSAPARDAMRASQKIFGAPIVLPNAVGPSAPQLRDLVAQYMAWPDFARQIEAALATPAGAPEPEP